MEAIDSIEAIDTLHSLDGIEYLKKGMCKESGRKKQETFNRRSSS